MNREIGRTKAGETAMGYMDEHGDVWSRDTSNDFLTPETRTKLENMRRRYENLEALATEVKRFVDQSSLLIGADRIRAILKRLESTPK